MAVHRLLTPTVREIAGIAALVSAVTTVMLWPLLRGLASHFAVNPSDAKLNSWVLAWGAERIAHGLSGYWSPPIYYPYPNVLAYSENLLGVAVVVAPLHWLLGEPILSYNVAVLLSFVVAGAGAYLLTVELTQSRAAGVIAALGFAFAPYRWAQLPHLQVLWTAWLPLVLWALHLALRTGRPSYWAAFVVVTLLQMFSNGYAAFQTALAVAIVLASACLMRALDLRNLRRLVIAVGVIGLMLIPARRIHADVWGTHDPTPGDTVAYSADLSTYVSAAEGLPGARWLPGLAQDEGNLFPGTVVLLLAFVALAPWPGSRPAARWRWTYVAITVVAVMVSLGPEPRVWGRPLPGVPVYQWLNTVFPLFDVLRVPARFGVLAILAVNVLAAYGLARLVPAVPKKRHLVALLAGCALVVFDGYGGPVGVVPYSVASTGDEAAANEWLKQQPPGALLNLPMATLGETSEMRQQFAVLSHRHPTVSGVSRLSTPLVEVLSGSGSPLVVTEELPNAVRFLRGLGVRYVLMRAWEFHDPNIAYRLADVLSHDPDVRERGRFGGIVAWEIEPDEVPPREDGALREMASGEFALTASAGADSVSLAIDGRPDTRWLTTRPQDGSEWLAIDFDRPRNLARIDFVTHARSLINYPRLLEVAVTGHVAGGPEQILFRGSLLRELGQGWRRSPALPTASVPLPNHMASKVFIRQRGRAMPWFWAIDELVLWERSQK